jgi:hypothetical protein
VYRRVKCHRRHHQTDWCRQSQRGCGRCPRHCRPGGPHQGRRMWSVKWKQSHVFKNLRVRRLASLTSLSHDDVVGPMWKEMVRCKGDRQVHVQLRIAWVGVQQENNLKNLESQDIWVLVRSGRSCAFWVVMGRYRKAGMEQRRKMSFHCISGKVV